MVVGIIGGGQLGMFLGISAYQMGYLVHVYDPNSDCCAKGIAQKCYQGEFNDYQKLADFAKDCDVIVYEFENIDSNIIKKLSQEYNIPQGYRALEVASSRINEKNLAYKLNIKQAKWQIVNNKDEIALSYPFILKSNRLGYDGKNQYLINNKEDLMDIDLDIEYIAEEKVTFDYEMSIIAFRDHRGKMLAYQPFYNIHKEGILDYTLLKEIPDYLYEQAKNSCFKIMAELEIIGILCCEFFVKNDEVYFNEMAPRPHNSGHITMDTHYSSQYENLIRVVNDLDIGNLNIKCWGFTKNVIGSDKLLKEIPKEYYFKYYDYHKEKRIKRKIGHLIGFDKNLFKYFKEEK